jgi:hypothetical protein
MKKSLVLLTLGLMLVLLIPVSGQTIGRTPWCFWNNYSVRLNLSSQQRVKLENLHQNFIKDISTTQNQLEARFRELRDLFLNPPLDRNALNQKREQISSLQNKVDGKILDYRLEALSVLTTEQILLLPSDCCLGINPGRGYGPGFGRGYGYGRGYGRGFGRGRGRGYRFWRR